MLFKQFYRDILHNQQTVVEYLQQFGLLDNSIPQQCHICSSQMLETRRKIFRVIMYLFDVAQTLSAGFFKALENVVSFLKMTPP